MVQFLKFQSLAIKRILKINNSWPELFNFQNSFKCYRLEHLRTAPFPIHKVIIHAIWDMKILVGDTLAFSGDGFCPCKHKLQHFGNIQFMVLFLFTFFISNTNGYE